MALSAKRRQEYDWENHPSKDTTKRHNEDQELREFGFVIHSRPSKGEPVWSYGGELIPHREALDILTDLKSTGAKL